MFGIGWGFRLSLDFFPRGLHTRTAVARFPLRQLGFLVVIRRRVYSTQEAQVVNFDF